MVGGGKIPHLPNQT